MQYQVPVHGHIARDSFIINYSLPCQVNKGFLVVLLHFSAFYLPVPRYGRVEGIRRTQFVKAFL